MAQKLQEQLGSGQRVSDQKGLFIQRRRASVPSVIRTQSPQPASRHYAGHYAGNHPEDTPYITQDRPRRAMQPQVYDDEEDDDDIYPQRPPTSTRRYLQPRQEVYTDGNRNIVVHREPPPKK